MQDELRKRIAQLPPEKRKLFARLLESQGVRISDVTVAPDADTGTAQEAEMPIPARANSDVEGHQILLHQADTPDVRKAKIKSFYDRMSQQLDSSDWGQYSRFLNYGYVANDSPQYSGVDLPQYVLNRNSVKLVLELIGDCDLTGLDILDVGCGRGGTIEVIATYFAPRHVIGVDLSSDAIAFCAANNGHANVAFEQGDAENLRFEDSIFDVVTNVESSHSYPDIGAFYAHVLRVLKPGGCFLYTDNLPVEVMGGCLLRLQEMGFVLERDTDITQNVLLSCDKIARQRLGSFSAGNDQQIMHNFLAVPDSAIYEDMRNGETAYRIFRLRKPVREL
jgi:SAM-dependent methyltransferase